MKQNESAMNINFDKYFFSIMLNIIQNLKCMFRYCVKSLGCCHRRAYRLNCECEQVADHCV